MGILEWRADGKRIALRGGCLLGRHPGCDIRIDSAKVSGEHAALHWRGNGWEIRDLDSRNGTYVNGKKLTVGERVLLNPGTTFSLSHNAAIFELVDATPPTAGARNEATGQWIVATHGLLALPSEQRPIVTLFSTSDGQWTLETVGSTRIAKDQEQLRIDNELYTLEVPMMHRETLASAAAPPIESIRLRLGVTPDEEHVETTVLMGDQERRLPSRRYHYLLVTLARAWLADSGAPPSMRGFIDRDHLCRKLAMDVNKLNVEIHRARKQLAAIGIEGSAGLIERRPSTLEVRIGVHDVEVVRL